MTIVLNRTFCYFVNSYGTTTPVDGIGHVPTQNDLGIRQPCARGVQ